MAHGYKQNEQNKSQNIKRSYDCVLFNVDAILNTPIVLLTCIFRNGYSFLQVKPLPFKGSGKHKYSFRNIEVPSYPIHFCDCEEHCGPPEAANDEYASVLNAVSYEKERNIMNSVMSKLFEKENEHFESSEMEKSDVHINMGEPSEVVNQRHMEQTEGAPGEDLDDIQMEETEEPSDEDLDDDLVINIAPRKSSKSIVQVKTENLEVNEVHIIFNYLLNNLHVILRFIVHYIY